MHAEFQIGKNRFVAIAQERKLPERSIEQISRMHDVMLWRTM